MDLGGLRSLGQDVGGYTPKDLQDFKSCLSRARRPAGFLIAKLCDLEKAINAQKGTQFHTYQAAFSSF